MHLDAYLQPGTLGVRHWKSAFGLGKRRVLLEDVKRKLCDDTGVWLGKYTHKKVPLLLSNVTHDSPHLSAHFKFLGTKILLDGQNPNQNYYLW